MGADKRLSFPLFLALPVSILHEGQRPSPSGPIAMIYRSDAPHTLPRSSIIRASGGLSPVRSTLALDSRKARLEAVRPPLPLLPWATLPLSSGKVLAHAPPASCQKAYPF
ncbi:diphthine--ammonia ligase-like protein [Labeo rohita]|uniref:Diphthine--ammonia ligase-like protein n=1 Tax=Labeo rohita TaxID=84645 RepID=A0A498MX74_LABRO|nr:diphthine--ammonia ligase-like protein [Labeo rohita]RXN37927.1 diphthine--ammonia ligase-like protein [Labeo rohita]